ncbi:hypothetical protein ED733_002374 [Metarhizium rileyi]|uniref:Cytochrome P450 n=1 Tax=Metarhizium rileyi (strain RCEF 4871) TaxID=1649241 RepID=A0A5C6G4W5_METRR|nr:hypothetical protein ED733_002374 [Metarhizium rileyi]
MSNEGEVSVEPSPWQTKSRLSTWMLLATITLISIRHVFRRVFPKPLPGIPYNKDIGILGDLPELHAALLEGSSRPWMWRMAKRHNSPIVQMFFPPFQKPSVIIVDYHESYDIIVRRTKEFDRSTRSTEIFSTVVPDHHIAMKSSDQRFKRNKELVKDLMTPSFLSDVSAPAIYNKAKALIDLWEVKTEVGQGRPFAAFQDINEATVDIILAVSFGLEDTHSIIRRQMKSLSAKAKRRIPAEPSSPVEFSRPLLPPNIEALITVSKSLHVSLTSPMPGLHHWILKKTKWKKQFQRKEEIITLEISKAVQRLASGDGSDSNSRSAMDLMILREMSAARKAGREPVFNMPSMRDELLGFLIGGSETSASVLGWTLKFLADNQDIQAKVRRQLHASYSQGMTEKREPTVSEIVHDAAPYLDAFIEESLRWTVTLPVLMRQATVDTSILGHHIPKDTTIVLMGRGASMTEPAVHVPDELRTKSSLASRERVPNWDDEDIALFKPERWLKTKEQVEGSGEFDNIRYDGNSGPLLTFGGGQRGCFGKRLAYLELRITLVLLIWNFDFEQCVPELSSHESYDVFTSTPRQCYVKLRKTSL